MSSKPSMDHVPLTPVGSFLAGFRAAATSVFSLVLIGTYVGVGALGHNYGFSLAWVLLSTLLVWAGPAQVILISTLGAGAPPLEAAVAVGLSGMRLLPMVVTLLALIKRADTHRRSAFLEGQPNRRRHAEDDGVVGGLDGEARLVGSGGRIRLRREFAQERLVPA